MRLDENLSSRNATTERPYALSLSVGVAEYHPMDLCSVHELLSRADAAMYEQKRGKRKVDPILS
jgi:PleD family two-component response regulator